MEIVKHNNPDGTFIETVIWEKDGICYSVLKSIWDEQQVEHLTEIIPADEA